MSNMGKLGLILRDIFNDREQMDILGSNMSNENISKKMFLIEFLSSIEGLDDIESSSMGKIYISSSGGVKVLFLDVVVKFDSVVNDPRMLIEYELQIESHLSELEAVAILLDQIPFDRFHFSFDKWIENENLINLVPQTSILTHLNIIQTDRIIKMISSPIIKTRKNRFVDIVPNFSRIKNARKRFDRVFRDIQ